MSKVVDIKTARKARKTRTTRKAKTQVAELQNDGLAAGKGKGGTVKVHGGTTTGYQRGCRCDECKAAMAAYSKARREAGKSEEQKAAEKKAKQAAARKAKREAKKAEEAAAAAQA